ncbi:MAG: S8 family serine peptidase [Pontibacter sp.]|nr:S8 family serine peptidase [Pontibacter sp.]
MRLLLLFISLLPYLPALAQGSGSTDTAEKKHLVYFTDKNNTPYSLEEPLQFLSPKSVQRRQRQSIPLAPRDLPVDPAYVAGLKDAGAEVWYTSRWFNAAVVLCSDVKLQELQALPYVKSSRSLNSISKPPNEIHKAVEQQLEAPALAAMAAPTLEARDYGPAFHQADMLGADELHAAGYHGEGMTIAVFDAGFPAVNTIEAFSHLFQRGQMLGTFDFVENKQNVYSANSHGTAVLSTMAAYAPGSLLGTAYAANYLLLRTEDAATKHQIEEINWLLAAEYADSAGADIINSSLGYTTFDTPSKSYTYQDLDGNTTLVSQAADLAAATGMLVVVSAGNNGNDSWHYISAPADADSVLAVGAVDSLGTKALFSSFGPTADGQVKPDVVAMGQGTYFLNTSGRVVRGNGTSFSAPVMAGFVASLWQANLRKTNLQMIQLLRQISSNANSPDNSTGYGIPRYANLITALPKVPSGQEVYMTNPVKEEPVVLYLAQPWLQQQVEVLVLDAAGKRVHMEVLPQAEAEQALQLRAQRLKSGLYLCRIRSGNRITTIRFVKL